MKSKSLTLLLLISVFNTYAQEDSIHCNTLKWKTIQLCHTFQIGSDWYLDTLEGKYIDMNEYNPCYMAYEIMNVSNDTFYQNEKIHVFCRFDAHVDTGYLSFGFSIAYFFKLEADKVPNSISTYRMAPSIDPHYFYSQIEGNTGVTSDKIDHWKFYHVVYCSSKDDFYSDSVIQLGKMEATFTFTEGTGIFNYPKSVNLTLYPNPANEFITIDNEDIPIKEVCFYNLVGQKVKQMPINATQANINIQEMPPGMYIIKINTAQGMLVKKIQIIR